MMDETIMKISTKQLCAVLACVAFALALVGLAPLQVNMIAAGLFLLALGEAL